MTTEPLQEPLNLRAKLYQADRLLAEVMCRLSPAAAPVSGLALVPAHLDLLYMGRLTLVQCNGQRYQVMPAKLERADDAQNLFRFYIRA